MGEAVASGLLGCALDGAVRVWALAGGTVRALRGQDTYSVEGGVEKLQAISRKVI